MRSDQHVVRALERVWIFILAGGLKIEFLGITRQREQFSAHFVILPIYLIMPKNSIFSPSGKTKIHTLSKALPTVDLNTSITTSLLYS